MFFESFKNKYSASDNIFLSIIFFVFRAVKIYSERLGSTLAAASTFYFILTIVPLTLLVLRLMGIFFHDVITVFESLFDLALNFFPNVAPQMFVKIKDLVRSAIFADKGYTILNMGILFWTSLAFFNSVWRGLSIIDNSPSLLKFKMYLRGIFIISFSAMIFSAILITPPLLQGLLKFVQTNPAMQFMIESFPLVKQVLNPLLKFKLTKNFLIKSDIASFFIFYLYLMFIYRWLFSFKLDRRSAIISVFVFLGGVFCAKHLFWLYLRYVREGLVRNYGDYYTIILGLVWVYFVMSLFYFSMCIAQVFIEKNVAVTDELANIN